MARPSKTKEAILKHMKKGKTYSPAHLTGQLKLPYSTVYQVMLKLLNQAVIVRESRGIYALA